ncbi:hypothetical protein B7494_g272 [Chlorociboria aeruginascens]|nr:hypothetical protein B7494_g272 [Chlorociboria aeruginascens]
MASPSEEAQYSAIIDSILATSDLNTITRKDIKAGLEKALGYDISDKKVCDQTTFHLYLLTSQLVIKTLITDRFNHLSAKQSSPLPAPPASSPPIINGHSHIAKKIKPEVSVKTESSRSVSTPASATPDEDSEEDISPPKKKRKSGKQVDDAKLAALLQAQENSRARSTRGGEKKKTPRKKTGKPKKKSEKKVKGEDDSDLELNSDGEVKEVVRKGGFHKQYHLSTPLADLVGEPTLSRPQVVKKIWAYIKERDLQDPSDKRQIICDDKMHLVFKQDKVHMFTMNKILAQEEKAGGLDVEDGVEIITLLESQETAAREEDDAVAGPVRIPELHKGPRLRGTRMGGDTLSTQELAERLREELSVEEGNGKGKAVDGDGLGKAGEGEVEAEVCFICASTVVHISVAPCNHRMCHICALRMRALYKGRDCPHCRTSGEYVVFTDNPNKRFEDFTETDFVKTDKEIGIQFDQLDIWEDVQLLLRWNCPDASCDVACLGLRDLHHHVWAVHRRKMCHLCTESKKVFSHEHELFTERELQQHKKKGDDNPGAIDQSGFKGHPLCDFCNQRFYGDDELFIHCRGRHESCFICDRQTGRPNYYVDVGALRLHNRKDHFPCPHPECQPNQLIVFGSEIDLKAHQLEEHGNTLSKDVRRDARVVDISSFDYRTPYVQERRGGGSQREQRGRGRGRDPNTEPLPISSAQPLRRDEQAFQRQLAIHSAQSVSTRTFGGQLTSTPAPIRSESVATSIPPPSINIDSSPASPENLSLQEQARQLRHQAVIERASALLENDQAKLTHFRNYISSFRNNSISARALIDSFFSLFSTTPATIGTLIREIADLFEDRKKADSLQAAWNDWRAINEDYPSLPGPSASSALPLGWATTPSPPKSGAKANRVLKLKSSTAQSSRSQVSQSRSWGTASNDLSSTPKPTSTLATNPFPALLTPSSRPAPQGRITTMAWVPPSSNSNPNSVSSSVPSSKNPSRGPEKGGDAFPALPPAKKPQTTIFGYGRGAVMRDTRGARETGFVWGGNANGNANGNGVDSEAVEAEGEDTGDNVMKTGGKKKGNKGKKQVLMGWG